MRNNDLWIAMALIISCLLVFVVEYDIKELNKKVNKMATIVFEMPQK